MFRVLHHFSSVAVTITSVPSRGIGSDDQGINVEILERILFIYIPKKFKGVSVKQVDIDILDDNSDWLFVPVGDIAHFSIVDIHLDEEWLHL